MLGFEKDTDNIYALAIFVLLRPWNGVGWKLETGADISINNKKICI